MRLGSKSEPIHGKDEVIGSIPIEGSSDRALEALISQCFKGFYMSSDLVSFDVRFTIIGLEIGLKSVKIIFNGL